MSWEDDKDIFGPGILWRSAEAHGHVMACDKGNDDVPWQPSALSADESEWELRWLMLSRALGRLRAQWHTTMVAGHWYYVIGVPLAWPRPWSAGAPRPALEITRDSIHPVTGLGIGVGALSESKAWLRLEGSPMELVLARVRSLGGRIQGLDHARTTMNRLSQVLSILDGTFQAMLVEGQHWVGLLLPGDMWTWGMDATALRYRLMDGLPQGMMRWQLRRHDAPLDTFDVQVLEMLATRIRARDLARAEGGETWLLHDIDSMSAMLCQGNGQLPGGCTRDELQSRLFRLVSRTMLHGMSSDTRHKGQPFTTRLAERTYIFNDSISLGLSSEFVNMADSLRPSAMLGLIEHDVLEGTAIMTAVPDWYPGLPLLANARVNRFLAAWDGSVSSS